MTLEAFTIVAKQIAATNSKNEKERLLAAYFQTLDDASLERAAVFFAGSPFPNHDERVTGVGWSTIAEAAAAASGVTRDELFSSSVTHGDLGDALAPSFPERTEQPVTVVQLGEIFDHLAATSGTRNKTAILTELFQKLDREGARFVAKILQNEFRIGLQQGLVEAAIARAFERKLGEVRRAQMFTSDLGTTALLARAGTLDAAVMRLFHPLGFMLAQPEEDPAKIVEALGEDALADDKYDGMRAQIHFDGKEVRVYSRTLDQITTRFPEVVAAASTLPASVILDGEIVAYAGGILPFAVLQTRLGRRKLSEKLLAEAPVTFFAFDLLFLDGEVLFERPLQERLEKLGSLLEGVGAIRPSHQSVARNGQHLDQLFDAARARGNEGLVVKAANSLYTPGRRGKSWLKYKKALATLDCAVTAAEYGHGKRRGVLSDYTFAVMAGNQLQNIGKAYSGVTDKEIEELTAHFLATTTAKYGPVHVVKPEVVLEIAFDRIQESARHKSGYALRFPRIAHVRRDKTVAEISTIDEVRRIYEAQLKRESGALEDSEPKTETKS